MIKPLEFIEDCVASNTDECILWPFAKSPHGYGAVRHNGATKRVTRLICERVYRPTQGREYALHSCDNPACCNPRHLRWGTQKDNAQDRESRKRGNQPAGARNGRSKLTPEQVTTIKNSKLGDRNLARQFDVSHTTISHIRKRINWKHIVT